MMATSKKTRTPLSENSVTAMLMGTKEWVEAETEAGAKAYPFLSRKLLADPELLDHAPMRDIALKIIAAYAAEHPLPTPTAEEIAICVDWKNILRGPKQGRDGTRQLAQARREVAEEVGKTTEAVKQDHTRVLRARRVKLCPI